MRWLKRRTTKAACSSPLTRANRSSKCPSESSIRTRPFYYANIDVDPQNPDVVYGMATRNMKSVDGGKTWERLPPPHGDNHDMWINPDNPDLFNPRQ